MLLSDTDRTSDSKTVEDVFFKTRLASKRKKEKWNNDKGNKVPVLKDKCHSCLEKGHYAVDCPKPKKNTERANRKGKNESAYSVLRQTTIILSQ